MKKGKAKVLRKQAEAGVQKNFVNQCPMIYSLKTNC
jgi:hypothetical protein